MKAGIWEVEGGLVLASLSPRRRELLEGAGLSFQVMDPGEVELEGSHGLPAEGLCLYNARAKSLAVSARVPGPLTLGADTVVVLDGVALGKPGSHEEAVSTLERLGGRAHRVLTAYSLTREGEIQGERVVETEVTFRDLEPREIQGYVDSGEPMDKAGAYGIQGRAAGFVSILRGSYTNVVGLPLSQVIEDIRALGVGVHERQVDYG